MSQKAVLIVLDGFGIGKDSPFNAIQNADMPFYRDLWAKYPHSQLLTHGGAVGLPDGVMGNSEVGHMTMGAGRIIYQDLTRIHAEIASKKFYSNPVLLQTIRDGARQSGRVHLMGLLSDAGVHSHLDHLKALIELCKQERVREIYVHAFLDGRDTPPDSAPRFIRQIPEIASIMGRYYAMDRDKRWERVKQAFDTLTGQTPSPTRPLTALEAVEKAYAAGKPGGKTDEFVEPVLLNPGAAIRPDDAVIFYNYRSDRARELTEAFTSPTFTHFKRPDGFPLPSFAGMTQYDATLTGARVAYGPQNLNHLLGEWLEIQKLSQFRIAETEKYAHVTFFFNGGREAPFLGEDRVLVPSPRDVATYDLKPEMSAYEVARQAAQRIESGQYGFVLMNFANADMVGHTGSYEAAIRAMEAIDRCLATVIGAAQRAGYHVLLTADHGNAEEMQDDHGRPHTQHTLNPVPALWIAPGTAIAPQSHRQALRDGGLQDVMPTLCQLMGLPVPPEVTGQSLVPPNILQRSLPS